MHPCSLTRTPRGGPQQRQSWNWRPFPESLPCPAGLGPFPEPPTSCRRPSERKQVPLGTQCPNCSGGM